MNILVELVHPAHFYYYRDTIANLKRDGHKVIVAIVTKDVLEDVVRAAGVEYVNICPVSHKKWGKIGVAMDMVKRDWRMLWLAIRNRVDIITGSTIETAHIGWLLRKPNINIGEDDAAVVSKYIKSIAPFVGVRLTPDCTDNGPIEAKSVHFPGYFKTAYLRPGYFTPDAKVVSGYGMPLLVNQKNTEKNTESSDTCSISTVLTPQSTHEQAPGLLDDSSRSIDSIAQTLSNDSVQKTQKILSSNNPLNNIAENPFAPYFILRFASLNAHHDSGIKGINTEIAQRLIDILAPHGTIYITSERPLEPQFEQFRIRINPLDMHHVMAFSSLYIGDSQTMAAEAGVLGVPFVRFNDFVGRIGYLRELEDVYQLGYGIHATPLAAGSPIHRADGSEQQSGVEALYAKVQELVAMKDEERKALFQERRMKMLSEKIDCTKFLTWFIEQYPASAQEVKNATPDFWDKFK